MFRTATANTTNAKSSNSSLFQKEQRDSAFIQPKLSIGKPGDRYEVEADRVADTIVARGNEQSNSFFSPAPLVQKQSEEEVQQQEITENEVRQKPLVEHISPLVQRQTEEQPIQQKEEQEEVQQKPEEEIQKKEVSEDTIQQKTENNSITPDIQKQEEEIQEKEEEEEETPIIQQKTKILQRKEIGVPTITNTIESRIQRASGNGRPMEKDVQNSMESGFGANFSNVQIHTNQESSSLNNQISSKAFTYKNNVFFGENQYQPDTNSGKHLLAHELTHVVQQGQAGKKKSEVTSETVQPQIQRLGVSDALDYFADKAYLIPGFRMFTIILGINPINMSSVDRSAANIMRAIVEFLPGGNLITRVLDKYNVFTEAADFMKERLDTLNLTGESIKDAIDDFLDSLGWSDIFDLGGVWERAKKIFTSPITKVINLGKSVLTVIYEMVRKAILLPLATLAQGTRGYDLLKALLGKDPITGDPYPPTAENVIGGFMKLIGQEEVWENIKQGNAVAKAWAWFQGALSGLMGFVILIPTTIINTIKSLTWEDIIILPNAFIKVGKAFVNIATDFISWGLTTVIDLLEILFSVVAPGVVPYIKKAKGAFNKILENPIAFVGNLIKAAKLGFQKFATNIGKHLKKSLLSWLLGSLAGAGIHIPQSLDFKEIIKFVASVLGLTWENLRLKLVKHLGEPAVKALETGFELVKLLVTEGPAAAWEKIMEHLSNLKTMVLQEISQFVIVQVVKKAITKLVMMLNPAGAVIQAIIAIYDTITFLIEKIKQIAKVGAAVIDSISAIANGVITQAAAKVESTLAGMLTLAINFLAKFAGLGKISEAIINIIKKIREPIDKAMDNVVGWIVTQAKSFIQKGKEKIKGAIDGLLGFLGIKKKYKDASGKKHDVFFEEKGDSVVLIRKSVKKTMEDYLASVTLSISQIENKEERERFEIILSETKALAKQIDTKRLQATNEAKRNQLTAGTAKTVDGWVDQLVVKISNFPEDFNDLSKGSKIAPVSYFIYSTPINTQVTTNTGSGGSGDGQGAVGHLVSAESGGDIGSKANYSSALYSYLKNTLNRNVVQGHIIHDELHGPGNDAKNIVPLPSGVNGSMGVQEGKIAQKVKSENKVIFYKVTVDWPSLSTAQGKPRGGYSVEDELIPNSITIHHTEMEFKPASPPAPADLDKEKAKAENWKKKGSEVVIGFPITPYSDPPPSGGNDLVSLFTDLKTEATTSFSNGDNWTTFKTPRNGRLRRLKENDLISYTIIRDIWN